MNASDLEENQSLRCFLDRAISVVLHGFADASSKALGSYLYANSVHRSGTNSCASHISSKDAERVRAVVVRFYNRSVRGLIPFKPAQDLRRKSGVPDPEVIQRFPVEACHI
ncbi:hypothetical protein TNCT_90391 [Trichonephila clavata]|uniref:Uncharacterized protein n=1 Tax=Trichonephila clavata TaxID=2740835 RepID=A0A8X6KDB3_TRICU|nr:hypothetical protein TNCT_90391 [Trichonephila clavata]